jgi:hypothetical protein
MSDCLVTNFGILTNGAFSVCFRRGVVGGGAPAVNMIKQEEERVIPRMVVTRVKEDPGEKKSPISVTIKRIT